jgi:hypothetical protein
MNIRNKNRADYQWSYTEKLEHLIKLSGEWMKKTHQMGIELREKVFNGIDTPKQWNEFNEAKTNADLYYRELKITLLDNELN